MLLFVLFAFGWSFYRLYEVQIVKGKEYHKGAIIQAMKNYSLNSLRGEIMDRSRKKLAANQTGYTPWVYCTDLEDDLDIEKTVAEITRILDTDPERLGERLKEKKGNFKLSQWIDKETADKLSALNIKGIRVEEGAKRYYPFGKAASYLIGFTNIDNEGSEGIEARYNSELSGIKGKLTVRTDAGGQPLSFADEKKYSTINGMTLVSTLDIELENMLEEAAKKHLALTNAKKAMLLVMEPKTGKILAMAQTPGYDLNNPRAPQSEEQRLRWEMMDQEELAEEWFDLWKNDAINSVYEPGSIFKIITAAAGLEENVTNENKHYSCKGIWSEIKNVNLRCVLYPDSHGMISLNKGFEQSCNIVFIELGRELGREKFYKYVRAFGFGEKTGVDLPGESAGLVQPFEKFDPVGLATASYGHGISITALQMITAASAVVNGGNLMKPYIIDYMLDEKGNIVNKTEPVVRRKVISENTSRRVNAMMRRTVETGTGKKLLISGYKIGAKTGTSVKMVNGSYSDNATVASMVATVPSDDPKYIFLGLIDEPQTEYRTGGVVVGAMLRDAMEEALPYLGVPIDEASKENSVSVPNLVGMKTLDAGRKLNGLNIKFKTEFADDKKTEYVIAQSVPEGISIKSGEVIILTLGENPEQAKEP